MHDAHSCALLLIFCTACSLCVIKLQQGEEVAHTINFIKIDCSSLKLALVGHCVQWQGKLTSLLNTNALADLRALHDLFASTTATLRQQPANLDHLSESWTLLEQMKRHDAPAVEEKFAPLEEVEHLRNHL
jgi:dynein heavy chain, axonemal